MQLVRLCTNVSFAKYGGDKKETMQAGRPPQRAVIVGLPRRGNEMAGLYFEQFSVGQTFVHEIRRTVTDMDNILFSSLTYNPAAVHIDHEYAKSTEFGKPLINSIFTLGLVIGLSVQDTTLGTTVANLGMTEITFPKPVFSGDTIRSRTTVVDKRDSRSRPNTGIVIFRHDGMNQRNETVCICMRQALMQRKPSV